MGESASSFDAQFGARARFDAANAAGGVDGRRIEFLGWRDDRGTAADDLHVGRDLARQGVLAVVPVVTPTFGAAPYLARRSIPSFGWGISTGFCRNPHAFAITGCLAPSGTVSTAWGGLVRRLVPPGVARPTAAVLGQSDAAGRAAADAVARGATAAGFHVVLRTSTLPPPPAPVLDPGPFAAPVLTSNAGAAPDAVFLAAAFPLAHQLADALAAGGYRGVVSNATSYDPRLVAASAGQAVITPFGVPELGGSAMRDIVARIQAVNGGTPVSQAALAGYLSADLFVQALRRAGRHPTAASVSSAAASLTFRIAGVVGPTRFPAAEGLPTPCGAVVRSTGRAFVPVEPYTCFTNVDARSLSPVRR